MTRMVMIAVLALACSSLGCGSSSTRAMDMMDPHATGSGRARPPITVPLFHVLAGPQALPMGDTGYLISADGHGGYRVSPLDVAGGTAHFHGSIFTDGTFAKPIGDGGAYVNLPTPNRVDFDGVPGTAGQSIAIVPSSSPIYVDLMMDGASTGFAIFYTSTTTFKLTTAGSATMPTTPAAFVAP